MLDPSPKFYMGDSRSYIATAVTGWIPPDRSFFYGYVIRWLAVWTSSLTPLLIFQTLVGAMTAIMVAAICTGAMGLPPLLSFAAGLAGWAGNCVNGSSESAISMAFKSSPEYLAKH